MFGKKMVWGLCLCLLCMCAFGQDASDNSVITKLTRAELVKMDGGKLGGAQALSEKKVIGLYFSAHWCPPCRSFTPKLVAFRNACVAKNQPFEIVFVSYDKNEQAMMEYMKGTKMGWVAVPFNSKLRNELGQHFNVRGIPSLIILDSKGNTLSTDGRGDVTRNGAKAYEMWAAKISEN